MRKPSSPKRTSPSPVTLRTRVGLIHEVDFVQAMKAVADAEGVDLPDPPAMMFCPFPSHPNVNTPAFSFQRRYWRCHGCGEKGDVIEFAKHLLGTTFPNAVEHVERVLGIGGDELAGLAGLLRRTERPDEMEWRQALAGIEAGLYDLLRPYLLCRDPLVVGYVRPEAEYVFGCIWEAEMARPLTQRGRRESLRTLRTWATEYVRATERRVEALTGRDRADIQSLTPPMPEPLPAWVGRLIPRLAKRLSGS